MKQKEITYHFIPRGSGISLIDSKKALFLCDSITEINPRAYSFHLKNYYDDRGIRTYSTKKPADSSQILAFEFSGSRNLWIKARNYRQIKERFDRVMISNNAVWQIDRQFEIFPDQIILDDTNSRKRISSLKAQADSLGIELIALYDTGGITFTY
jgi:competence protein ComEC